MRTILAGGRILDPSQNLDLVGDLLIEDGRIVGITPPGETRQADEVIPVDGLLVTPGLIDIHVHLREPGFEYKEDIESGTHAAAAGGFTSVCCMPNTNPAIDSAPVVHYIRERAEKCGLARVFPIAAATKGMEGGQLTEMAELRAAGAIAISDDAFPIQSAETMRRVMEYCAMLDLPLLTHNEDKSLTAHGAMNEGYVATVLGIAGMPRVAEDIAVARNILLCEYTGCRLHLLHISSARTVQILRQAKAKGLPVTGEACPHHWVLTEEACFGYNTDAKMNPPLRTAQDCEAIKEALADGTIDCIATDHAPHAAHEKETEFETAPFGIVGLETAFALSYTHLVLPGKLTLNDLIARLTWNPARILALPHKLGTLQPNALADVAVFDLDAEWTIDRAKLHSKSKNTPFHGAVVKGKPLFTLLNGRKIEVNSHD